jgi:hypothetical protein
MPTISDRCENIFCTIHILKCWGILVNRQDIEKKSYIITQGYAVVTGKNTPESYKT